MFDCSDFKNQPLGIQTEKHVPNQGNKQPMNCEGPVGDRWATVKLEPTWTSTFLREWQEIDSDLKIIIGWKKAEERKPLWEEVLPQTRAVKTLCHSGTIFSIETVHFVPNGKKA